MFSSKTPARFSVGWCARAGLDSTGPRVMEDAMTVNEKKGVFGIFDGNGKSKKLLLESMNLSLEDWSWARQKLGVGYDISDQLDPWELSSYLRDHMPSAFFDEMISDEESLEHRVRNLFGMFHNKLRDRCMMGSSSTALLLFVDETNDNLTVANCGDTRAILCRAGRALQLTRDQKSDLNLGSEGFDQRQITVHHERLDKGNDSFIVLLSDGVYNAFERGNDDVIDVINQKMQERPYSIGAIAKNVVDRARKREEEESEEHQKIDDMTVIVISLNETLHLTPIEITSSNSHPSGSRVSLLGWRLLAGRRSSNAVTCWLSLSLTALFTALCIAVLIFVSLKLL